MRVASSRPSCHLFQQSLIAPQNNKDYFDQSLDEVKLLRYINAADSTDRHGILRLHDYFYYRVRTPANSCALSYSNSSRQPPTAQPLNKTVPPHRVTTQRTAGNQRSVCVTPANCFLAF